MPNKSDKGGKFLISGTEMSAALLSNYLNDIHLNTVTKTNVKNVEDIQKIIGYYNHVVADIQAKKKKM